MSVNEYSIKTYLFYQDYKLFWGKNQNHVGGSKKPRTKTYPRLSFLQIVDDFGGKVAG